MTTPEDLLKQFDLQAAMATSTGEVELEEVEAAAASPLPATALQLDEWGLHKGQELLQESELLRAVYVDELAPTADPDDSHADTLHKARDYKLRQEQVEHEVADMFGAAFELEPQPHEASQDAARHEFVSQLLDTPEYKSLHAQTQLDAQASELAAAAFARQLVELKEQQKGEDGKGGEDGFGSEMRTMGAVSQALGDAQQDVDDLNDAREALGAGLGQGGGGQMDSARLSEQFRLIRNSAQLRRICELAGRYRRLAQARQRRKTKHGLDDMVGVVLDGDVGRLVGSELAQLTADVTRTDALRRLVERQSMCRDHRGVERVAKGPVIVFLDESSSMSGNKSYQAKAIALALAWVARKQRRWVCLAAFSGHSDVDSLRLHAMPPGKADDTACLLDWLTGFLGGGTTLDWLHGDVMDKVYRRTSAESGKTDLVLVTDGAVNFSQDVQDSFAKWKQRRQAKLTSLVMGGVPLSIERASDSLHRITGLGVEQEGVGEVLGI